MSAAPAGPTTASNVIVTGIPNGDVLLLICDPAPTPATNQPDNTSPNNPVVSLPGQMRIKHKTLKMILCTGSELFRARFQKKPQSTELRVILAPEFQELFVENVLGFLYSGKIKNVAVEDLVATIHLANKFGVTGLVDSCCSSVEIACVADCIVISEAVVSGKLLAGANEKLAKKIGEFLADYFDLELLVSKSEKKPEYLALPIFCLSALLAEDALKASCENTIVHALRIWGEESPCAAATLGWAPKLVPLLRLHHCDTEFLSDIVSRMPIIPYADVTGVSALTDAILLGLLPVKKHDIFLDKCPMSHAKLRHFLGPVANAMKIQFKYTINQSKVTIDSGAQPQYFRGYWFRPVLVNTPDVVYINLAAFGDWTCGPASSKARTLPFSRKFSGANGQRTMFEKGSEASLCSHVKKTPGETGDGTWEITL